MLCDTLNERQTQTEAKLVDLQYRNMDEKPIFTGFSENSL